MERKSMTSSAAKSARSTDSKPFLRMGRGSVAPPAPPQDTYAFDCSRRMRCFSFLPLRRWNSFSPSDTVRWNLSVSADSQNHGRLPVFSRFFGERRSIVPHRPAARLAEAFGFCKGTGGGGGGAGPPPPPPPVPTPIETRNGVSSRKLRFPVSYSFSIIIGGGAARFTVKQNSLPSPTLLVTQIFSPICSSISRAMDSPRPEPMPLCALSTL